MGRKKRRAGVQQQRIFCYYCDRNFANEQTLLSHQKEKHLRCPTCNKRMISVSGLVIHSQQVHNVAVTAVPNAIPGRTSTAVDVVGMNGIPPSFFAEHAEPLPKQARFTAALSAGAYAAQRYYAPPAAGGVSVSYAPAPYPYQAAAAYPYAQPVSYPQPYSYPAYASVPVPAPAPPVPSLPVSSGVPTSAPVPPVKSAIPSVATPVIPSPTTVATPVPSAKTPTVVTAAPTVVSSAATNTNKTSQQVTVVFEHLHESPEELRARLPRYKLPDN